MEKKTEKMVFVFNMISFKQGTRNSHTREQDTCNPQFTFNKHPYDS